MQDLRTLAIFVKVAERLSFVRAAADLGITQSGVSNAISRLEDQIGTPLLARTTRRVSLTEHGAAYFERCRQALAELEEAELVLKNAQLKPSGNLRIDMPVSFGRLKVVPLLGAFQARYPDIALRVTFNDRYVDHIEESIDVSIRFGVPAGLQPDRPAARRRAAQRRRRAALFRQIRPAEAAGRSGRAQLPGVHLPRNAPRQGMALRARRQAAKRRCTPKGNMSLSDGAAVCDAARAGYGLAQLQDFFIDALIARGQLVAVLEKFKPAAQPIWLVYPQARHLSPKVRVFVDFMVEKFKSRAGA